MTCEENRKERIIEFNKKIAITPPGLCLICKQILVYQYRIKYSYHLQGNDRKGLVLAAFKYKIGLLASNAKNKIKTICRGTKHKSLNEENKYVKFQ